MERKEAIRGAYRMTGGNSFYDGMITCSTLSGKAVCRLVWAMNKAENDAYLEKALSGIPEHFSGKLLEVPVGTGILTMPVYQTMPEADITCLDYSPDMMRQARKKADRLHLKNVTFRQGDVGALSYGCLWTGQENGSGVLYFILTWSEARGQHRLGAALLRFPTICGRRILFLIRRFYREINGKGTGTNEKR